MITSLLELSEHSSTVCLCTFRPMRSDEVYSLRQLPGHFTMVRTASGIGVPALRVLPVFELPVASSWYPVHAEAISQRPPSSPLHWWPRAMYVPGTAASPCRVQIYGPYTVLDPGRGPSGGNLEKQRTLHSTALHCLCLSLIRSCPCPRMHHQLNYQRNTTSPRGIPTSLAPSTA